MQDIHFNDLVDHNRIVAIDAALVPAGPTWPHAGDYLFVNCHYKVGHTNLPPHELLEEARADALAIVQRLKSPHIKDYVVLTVTVYGHIEVPGAARPARRRIYRISVQCKDLPENTRDLAADELARILGEESSELDDVAELLHQTTP